VILLMLSYLGPSIVVALSIILPSTALGQVASPPLYTIKSYMGRCLDLGPSPQVPGAVVSISDCDGTVGQKVAIQELVNLGAHQVLLRAGPLCIGANVIPPRVGAALVLQSCSNSAGQIFALDGDSIVMDSNLDLAVQLKDGTTKSGTPLVLGHRTLSDTELWDVTAIDGSGRPPTSGFKPASTLGDLQQALTNGPGTVIEIGQNIDISDLASPLAVSKDHNSW